MELSGIPEKDLEAVRNNSRRADSKMNEEFNNFMHRVTDVGSIIKKMASDDKEMQKMGSKEAELYLKDAERDILENIDEKNVKLRVKQDRTVLNKRMFRDERKSEEEMSQEGFMKEVEKDAERRYQDKKVREEKADTLKRQAQIAFRRREFEKAHILYSKAIEYIKDSCLLYTNRAVCEVQLKMYDEALKDTEMALKINEDSLKAWLLRAKAFFMKDNLKEFRVCVEEARNRNAKYATFVDEYVAAFAGKNTESVQQ